MITFLIVTILAIIALACISTGSIFLIVLGADLIVCCFIIYKLFIGRKKNK